MVVFSLWLPILVATALVYVASSVIHQVIGYHKKDFKPLPDEDGTLDALRGCDIPAGDYSFPFVHGKESLRDDAFRAKATRGPTGLMTLLPEGDPFKMGPQLAQWFAYCLAVSVFAGYMTGVALPGGAGYMETFRIASTAAFGGYALAHLPRSIWYGQNWGATARNVFDGLVYALLTGGAFGWLWSG